MKIELKNFGPIDHFEFDMDKDLHVIYGENNLGKSYAMSAVYLILKNFFTPFQINLKFDDLPFSFKKDIISVHRNMKSQIIIGQNQIIEKMIFEHISEKLPLLANSFKNSFPSIVNLKSSDNKKASILLKSAFIEIEISFLNNVIYDTKVKVLEELLVINFKDDGVEIDKKNIYSKFSYLLKISRTNNPRKKKIFESKGENLSRISNILGIVQKRLEHIINELFLLKGDLIEIYFLPASRSGLYHLFSNFGNILAKLSQFRFQINQKIEIPNLSEPVSDYFLDLSLAKQRNINRAFLPIISIIEEKILLAKVILEDDNSKIKYKQLKTDLTLDLSEASSMISELAPLVVYLKNVIGFKANTQFSFLNVMDDTAHDAPKILFIEEPEAHLHPKIQVEMMKVFVELVKAGVKVVMTTHSDYMKDTLSNLLLSGEIAPEKVASYRFIMGENGSYDAGDMNATDEGIEDHNFTSVAVELYEERVRLLEKRYEANDAQ